MANTKSAEKRNRQNLKRNERNRALQSRVRTAVRKLREVVEAGDATAAAALLPKTYEVLDATAQKRAIHTNTASRTKSRLAKAVAGIKS